MLFRGIETYNSGDGDHRRDGLSLTYMLHMPHMLIKVPSRTFDHIFGHRGPAKLIDKINSHTVPHRAIQGSTRIGQEAEGV